MRSPRQGVYVFLDMHRHLAPVTVRQVRDAIWIVKRKQKSLVFLGPVVKLPEELRLDATLLYYDPPDMTQLRQLVDALAGGDGLDPSTRETLARAVLGLAERETERVLRRGLVRHRTLGEACLREAVSEKRQVVRRDEVLECRDTDVTFADVGGLDLLKCWLEGRRAAFADAGRRFGLPAPGGRSSWECQAAERASAPRRSPRIVASLCSEWTWAGCTLRSWARLRRTCAERFGPPRS